MQHQQDKLNEVAEDGNDTMLLNGHGNTNDSRIKGDPASAYDSDVLSQYKTFMDPKMM
jgi:hypothetical protein